MLDLTKRWAHRARPTIEVQGLRLTLDKSDHEVGYFLESDEGLYTAQGRHGPDGEDSTRDLVPLQCLRTADDLCCRNMGLTLPTDSAERKRVPLNEGLLKYFPAALAGVAEHSQKGNDKHNPGQPLHHARGKSGDHADCILRHVMDLNDLLAELDRDPVRGRANVGTIKSEASSLAWRALALSQELHERFEAPLAPGARLSGPEEASVSQRDCRTPQSVAPTSDAPGRLGLKL